MCWGGIPGFTSAGCLHLLLTLSCCHGNTDSDSGRNGYFCLFNQGGGSTQVSEQGRSRGESTRKGRPVLSESRLTQTSQEVFSISKPADTHQGLQTPIRVLQTLPSTTRDPWAELAASGDSEAETQVQLSP